MTTLKQKLFLYTIDGIDHCPVLGTISPMLFKNSLKYEPDETDLFVVSYPKCGTSWTQYIMNLLLKDIDPSKICKNFAQAQFLEYFLGKDGAEKLEKPRMMKSHLPFDLIPYNPKAKYVYVTRNPFDCCTSFHNHHTGIKLYDYEGTFDEYFESFIRAEVDCGDYFDHVMSWYAHKDDDNVLFITYEEMKENIYQEIVKIGNFMGGKSAELVQDSKNIEKIVQLSDFDAMKKHSKGDFEELVKLDVCKKDFEFFRKGLVSGYKDHFNKSQVERLKEKYYGKMKGTYLMDQWNKLLGFDAAF